MRKPKPEDVAISPWHKHPKAKNTMVAYGTYEDITVPGLASVKEWESVKSTMEENIRNAVIFVWEEKYKERLEAQHQRARRFSERVV